MKQEILTHRCRFIEYNPSTINVISTQPKGRLVAVGRGGGDIEILDRFSEWACVGTIRGGPNVSVEGLAWSPTETGRLFSVGLHGWVTEWDVSKMIEKQVVESFGGAAWSIAVSQDGSSLAVGCEDGGVRLFDITDGLLQYKKTLERTGERVLSLAWHPDNFLLVAATAKSTVRVWDVRVGTCVHCMSVEYRNSQETLVWSVHVLRDGTAATGDSTGRVQFWDLDKGVQISSMKSHSADVLAIHPVPGNDELFSTGIDHTVYQYKKVKGKWISIAKKRLFTHDVRAIAVVPNNQGGHSLVAGGVDCQLKVLVSISNFPHCQVTRLCPFPRVPVTQIAKDAKSLLFVQNNEAKLFRLSESNSKDPQPALVLKMKISCARFAQCFGISSSASHIIFSSALETRIYHINDGKIVKIPCKNVPPCQSIVFVGKRALLCGIDGFVYILCLQNDSLVSVDKVKMPTKSRLDIITVSPDSQWFAVGDALNQFHVFQLDTLKHHSSTRTFGGIATAVAFHSRRSLLLFATTGNVFFSYDIEKRQQNSLILPVSFSTFSEPIQGIVTSPFKDSSICVWKSSGMCRFNMDKLMKKNSKRQLGEEQVPISTNYSISTQFRPLLLMDMLPDAMVVVERPWLSVLESLPPSFYRKRYGQG